MAKHSDLIVESLGPLETSATIAVIGSNPKEGTTTTTLALARNLVKNLSARVLVVDADFRHPSLHRDLKVSASPGLSDLLADPARPVDGLVQAGPEGFEVLTCGAEDAQMVKRLTSDAFGKAVAALKERYDYVLFDMSPVSRFPAVNAALQAIDGVVLVVACEDTRWEVAQNTKDKLEAAGGKVLGVIMNKRKFYIPGFVYRYV